MASLLLLLILQIYASCLSFVEIQFLKSLAIYQLICITVQSNRLFSKNIQFDCDLSVCVNVYASSQFDFGQRSNQAANKQKSTVWR